MKKSVVITGGAGFLGINLSLYLLENGYDVTLVDFTDRMNRLKFLDESVKNKMNFLELDLAKDKIELPAQTSYIVHLAAWPHVDFSYYYPGKTLYNNILSLSQVLDYAKLKDIPIIFASSVEVYGGVREELYKETDEVNPVSPYGASKHACEDIIKTYQRCYNIRSIIFRLTNLYGPWQLPDRIVPRTITRLLCSAELDIESNVIRDFVYVRDAVKAITMIMESNRWGEIYNISSGLGTSMKQIAEGILEVSEMNAKVIALMEQVDKQRGKSLIICNEKLKSDFGWNTEVGLREGIEHTFKWFSDNSNWWAPFKGCFMSHRNSHKFVIDCVFNAYIA